MSDAEYRVFLSFPSPARIVFFQKRTLPRFRVALPKLLVCSHSAFGTEPVSIVLARVNPAGRSSVKERRVPFFGGVRMCGGLLSQKGSFGRHGFEGIGFFWALGVGDSGGGRFGGIFAGVEDFGGGGLLDELK